MTGFNVHLQGNIVALRVYIIRFRLGRPVSPKLRWELLRIMRGQVRVFLRRGYSQQASILIKLGKLQPLWLLNTTLCYNELLLATLIKLNS